jgi:fyn-related kinase
MKPHGGPHVAAVTQDVAHMNINGFEIDFAELALEAKVGKGSFGVVWKGRWRGGLVAVKKMKEGIQQKEIEDFKVEASVMAKLRPHSHVVQFLGITTTPLCIVTEFMDMGSLYAFLHSAEKIDINMTIAYVKGIASGMHHLQSEGIVHRDLASRNVLLGTGNQVKISDFGLARLNKTAENQTKNNSGPLKWMAPESLEKRLYSVKTDVWSFAVTVWEILTREDPFAGQDPVQAAMKIMDPKNPMRLEVPQYTPPLLREILQQCFQPNPDQRPDFKFICDKLINSKLSEWTSTMTGKKAASYPNLPESAPPLPPRDTNSTGPPLSKKDKHTLYDSMPDFKNGQEW